MPIHPATPQNIAAAAELLRRGKLVALPTETVYGLGADGLNAAACAQIFAVKERPFFDPLIVHVADWASLEQLTHGDLPLARRLADRFWPGPLTLVLPKSAAVPDIVTAGLPTVAVRMPAHPAALELIRQAGTPIAAPSANLFGRLSPTTAAHVAEQLGERVEFILDGGSCSVGVESTIVDLSGAAPTLLRPGGISLEELLTVLGRVEVATEAADRPVAPGQLPSHYAPRTRLRLFDGELPAVEAGRRVGLLTLVPSPSAGRFAAAESLSASGDLTEAAANLFGALHLLDAAGLDLIYAASLPERGLGRAIMDRLRRAAAVE